MCVSVRRSLAARLLNDTAALAWPAGMPLPQVWLGFLLLFLEEVFWKGVRKGSRSLTCSLAHSPTVKGGR